MKSNFQIIIPMSGEGKRFKDFGYKELKPFIKVHKNYMINHVINIFLSFNNGESISLNVSPVIIAP